MSKDKYETTTYKPVPDSCYTNHVLEVSHNGCEKAPISGSNGIYVIIRDKSDKDKVLGGVVISYMDAVLLAGELLKMQNSHEIAMMQPNAIGESIMATIANSAFKRTQEHSDSLVLEVLRELPNAGKSNYTVGFEPDKSTLRQSIETPVAAIPGGGIVPALPKPLTDAEALLAMADGKQVFPYEERNTPDVDKHFYFLDQSTGEVQYRHGAAGTRLGSPIIPSKRGPGSVNKRTGGWMVWQNLAKRDNLSLQEAILAMQDGKVVVSKGNRMRYFLTDGTVKGIFDDGTLFNHPSNGPMCRRPYPGLWKVQDRGPSLPPLNSAQF